MSSETRAVNTEVSEKGIIRYPLAEEFYTLQGEGFHTGKAAAFVRLGGCGNGCPWCDTKEAQTTDNCRWLTAGEIAETVVNEGAQTAIITGGEPLQWRLDALTEALHRHNIRVFLETSGTHPSSGEFDWVCLSPKPFAPPVEELFAKADELKVVITGDEDLRYAEECAQKVGDKCLLYLQPEWSRRGEIIPKVVEYIKGHPEWKLSLQTHKFIDIP